MVEIKIFSGFCTMLLVAMLISSCTSIPIQSTDTELTIRGHERWKIQTIVVLSRGDSLTTGQFESNVDRIDPIDTMTATVSVVPDQTLLWIILLGLGGLGLLISGLGLSGRLPNWREITTSIMPKHFSTPASPGENTKYCPNCGNPNPMEAEFCTHCGTNFPPGPFMEA